MATILDRLRTSINMISPGGYAFEPKWSGNERMGEKKIGLFSLANINGTLGQDLGVNGDSYPLEVFFDGPNNDLDGIDFWRALHETGKWEVVHPLFGVLFLQLVKFRQGVFPVDSIYTTGFILEFTETLPDGTEISLAEEMGLLNNFADKANKSAIKQFEENTFVKTYKQAKALAKTVSKAVNAVKKNIRKFQNFNIIPAEITGLIRGIESTIAAFPIDTSALAAQIQQIIQLNVLAQDNTLDATDTFHKYIKSLDPLTTTKKNREGTNEASVQELALCSSLVAVAQSSVLPGIDTRAQAIDTANSILSIFAEVRNTLDESQTLFQGESIEYQFFSQSQSYSDNLLLMNQAARLLLLRSLNLKKEKRFTTKVNRNILEVCATEYGSIDDVYLDLLIDSNGLKNGNIRVIPALTELVVYVP